MPAVFRHVWESQGETRISFPCSTFGWRWGSRTAIVLGLVSFSHWVLDLFVHRADMPLFPGHDLNQFRFGIGLWRYSWTAASMESLLGVLHFFSRDYKNGSAKFRHLLFPFPPQATYFLLATSCIRLI